METCSNTEPQDAPIYAAFKNLKNSEHFSICACHPCAGAVLIFSVSFRFYRIFHEGIQMGLGNS